MNILVTGGAGFIGSVFINHLANKYSRYKTVNLDKLTYAGNPENIHLPNETNYKFIKGDICDRRLVANLLINESITHIINFAAETHVDRSIEESDEFYITNVLGTKNLLDCARNYGHLEMFYQISTDEVYGDLDLNTNESFSESTPLNPRNPYSASKAAADLLVMSYYHTYKFPTIISRCGNNYGPNQYPEKLIPFFIKKLNNKEKVPVYGDGLNVRDWIHVQDHADAIDKILHAGKIGEIYNIGGSGEISNLELTKIIIRQMKLDEAMIEFVNDRLGHDRRYSMDAGKLMRELDWQPKITFEEGIKNTIEHYCEKFAR